MCLACAGLGFSTAPHKNKKQNHHPTQAACLFFPVQMRSRQCFALGGLSGSEGHLSALTVPVLSIEDESSVGGAEKLSHSLYC